MSFCGIETRGSSRCLLAFNGQNPLIQVSGRLGGVPLIERHGDEGSGLFPLAESERLLQCCCMSKTDFDIHYTAKLARLELSPEEEETFGRQIAQVIDYVEQLQQLDVSGIEPTAHPVDLSNVTRSDITGPSLTNEEALSNAPAKANGLFMVPKIVE